MPPYTCELRLENPGARDDFERIEGDHLEGNENANVMKVEGYFQYSLNIPEIICRQFSSLEELILMSSKIEFLTIQSLENCVNLKVLSLEHNNITFLPNLVFSHSPHLEILDLSNNQIDMISDYSFNGTSLMFINLEGNELWYIFSEWFRSVKETLLLLDIANNEITILQEEVFSELTNLIELEIGFNWLR